MTYLYIKILGEMQSIGELNINEEDIDNACDALWCELKYITLGE